MPEQVSNVAWAGDMARFASADQANPPPRGGIESSFRLEVYLLVMLTPVAIWLGQTPVERALLIGSMLLVLAMELANSAIEAVIERYGSEIHELAGRAKDMGSAAVFVLMMNVLLCWALVVVPHALAGNYG